MISVVVSVYERPRLLDLCLAGLALQESAGEFEVVIADDGSLGEVRERVDHWTRVGAYPLRHARQERSGFRLAAARNTALRVARGDRIVFLDGDCVPPPHFLCLHREHSRAGVLLCGARVLLEEEETIRLPAGEAGARSALKLTRGWRRGRLLARRLTDRVERLLRLKERPKPLGANLSATRDDVWAVNGFDERYKGWGFEDEDFARRLARVGVWREFAPLAASVAHLWHPRDPTLTGRASTSWNAARYHSDMGLTRPRRGIEFRSLEMVDVRVGGTAPPHLVHLLRELWPRAFDPSPGREVTLAFFGTSPASFLQHGENVVMIDPAISAGSPRSFREFLDQIV